MLSEKSSLAGLVALIYSSHRKHHLERHIQDFRAITVWSDQFDHSLRVAT